MRELNILFLGAGRRKSLMRRFLKASEREKVRLKLFSYEYDVACPVADIATPIAGLMWWDPEFRHDILDIVKRRRIGVVIPCMDGATIALARIAPVLERERCWACVSPLNTCDMCADKESSGIWMEEHGILTPARTHLCPPTPLAYPVIIKEKAGYGSRNQYVVRDQPEFSAISSHLDMRHFIVQGFIHGDEFSIDCYVSREGKVLGVVPRRRIEVQGGEVTRSETVRDAPLIEKCEAILSAAKFMGPITIQCIRGAHGTWDQIAAVRGRSVDRHDYFTEINPRFGGGVVLSMEAGANYARLVIREALGEYVGPVRWIDGLLMTRSFEETFFDASPRPASGPLVRYKLREKP